MSSCDVCNNAKLLQAATCDEKAYRWSVLKSLCYIIEALETEEPQVVPETVILPSVTKTAAQVESGYSSFSTIGLVDSVKKLNYLRISNNTDCDLQFSTDGGASVAFTVLAGSTYSRSLNLTVSATTSLQMRKVSGETASIGTVYIEGDYAI